MQIHNNKTSRIRTQGRHTDEHNKKDEEDDEGETHRRQPRITIIIRHLESNHTYEKEESNDTESSCEEEEES